MKLNIYKLYFIFILYYINQTFLDYYCIFISIWTIFKTDDDSFIETIIEIKLKKIYKYNVHYYFFLLIDLTRLLTY